MAGRIPHPAPGHLIIPEKWKFLPRSSGFTAALTRRCPRRRHALSSPRRAAGAAVKNTGDPAGTFATRLVGMVAASKLSPNT